ncbi:DUF3365 domain-containing protein [Saprospira sp. CCB-QB6]|uniref:Tll0287-like domain-containing protein n=1 Tax=Saprospira sp. CCB-QB6 TaxID=3023936 RepID=UPI00234BF0BB|nr:DUF3365 domain-containing protein [Saprospira sp. CCB-QB6]WCL81242.1 DUF3365 domain-containing protein [Saprospira sp. CCB-QB6]
MKKLKIAGLLFSASLLLAYCSTPTKAAWVYEGEEAQDLKNKGAEAALKAQQTLLKTVKNAMTQKGVAGALSYCNLEALGLKAKLGEEMGVEIARRSARYRNPKDAPENDFEAQILAAYEQAKKEGKDLNSQIFENETHYIYYQPIMIPNASCLKCHGKPGQDIAETDLKKLRALYPEDKAQNYKVGDFRATWRIQWAKNLKE